LSSSSSAGSSKEEVEGSIVAFAFLLFRTTGKKAKNKTARQQKSNPPMLN
jgi:hypothetical protein